MQAAPHRAAFSLGTPYTTNKKDHPMFRQNTRTTAQTASTTQTQAAGVALQSGINAVTATVAGDAVKLPTATVGRTVTVVNVGSNSVGVFPGPGDNVNALAANAVYALAAGKIAQFVAGKSGTWYALLSA